MLSEADRWIEVHVVGIVVRMKLLLVVESKCYFHFSQKLDKSEMLRPRQVEHLHTIAEYNSISLTVTLGFLLSSLIFRLITEIGVDYIPPISHCSPK